MKEWEKERRDQENVSKREVGRNIWDGWAIDEAKREGTRWQAEGKHLNSVINTADWCQEEQVSMATELINTN